MSQSADQQAKPMYEPLHLPEDEPQSKTWGSRLGHFVIDGFGMSRKAKYLVAQMKQRGPILEEAWGPDAKRRALAKEISVIIQDEIGWPNAHFIPEDPFSLVIFNIYWDGSYMDGMEIECIAFRMAQLTGADHFDDQVWTALWERTLGEVVDALLEDPSGRSAAIGKVVHWPSKGPNTLEALPCTAPAIFFDIREFLTQDKYRVAKSSIRLSTPLRTLFQRIPYYELEHYLVRRFQVAGNVLRTFSPELDLPKAGLAGTLIVVAAFSALLGVLTLKYPDSADSSMWILPIMFAIIGLGVTFWFGLPALLSGAFWVKCKRLNTVRDLVKHIQRERARIDMQPTGQ